MILVTGAAGFIGAPLVRELRRRGDEVVALDDFSVGDRARLPEDLAVVEADLRDPQAVQRAVSAAAPRSVVHLAALHFIPDCVARPDETIARNVLATQHLLDALSDAPPERLLFASTGDVYSPADEPRRESDPAVPINVYGLSKLTGEWLVGLFAAAHPGCSTHALRLFNVYGPGETNPHVIPEILDQLRNGDTLRLGNVDARRDWLFLDDAVAAIAGMLDTAGAERIVNAAGGDVASVRELVDTLAGLTRRELTIESDPERLRPVDRPVLAADTTLLRSRLPGWQPTPLEEGLRLLLETER